MIQRSRPKFEINDENEKLLVAFKKAGMIDNYKESSEKEGYYKITRHKPAVKGVAARIIVIWDSLKIVRKKYVTKD